MEKLRDNIEHNLPYISVLTYGSEEYVGIIINQDQYVTSFYDYNLLKTIELKKRFLELGDVWWWESNRLIPINMFLKDEWGVFRPYLRTFNNKSLTIIHGPTCSISELNKRRSKRRSITLVKRIS